MPLSESTERLRTAASSTASFAPSSTPSSSTSFEKAASQNVYSGIQVPAEPHRARRDHANLDPESTIEYPNGLKLALLTIGVNMSIFLMALDFSIIATAIPKITDEFSSLDDIGWYGSSYLLTAASTTLLMGKCYSVFSLKPVFLFALFLFELGSTIAAAAQSSAMLIIGRAVAGLGNAGLLSGTTLIFTYSVPLKNRSMFMALTGGMYGIAAIAGPPLGGAFTERLSWRWCFWINLPFGAITMLVTLFCLKTPRKAASGLGLSLWQSFLRFDPIGTAFLASTVIPLLLALQWGGVTYAWNSGKIIALLTISGVSSVVFLITQWQMGESATLPPRIMMNRNIYACAGYTFTIGAGFYIINNYIPIWFQAVQGINAIESGVRTLPMLVGNIVATIIAGVGVRIIGYYAPFMIAGGILTPIAAGLLTLWTPTTASPQWIGFQAVAGLGIGLGWTQPYVAVTTGLALEDVPIATSVMSFFQVLSGAIFVNVAQSVFSNKLVKELLTNAPGLDPSIVVKAGAKDVAQHIPEQYILGVVLSFNNAITKTFIVATVMFALSAVSSAMLKWNSVKGRELGMSHAV